MAPAAAASLRASFWRGVTCVPLVLVAQQTLLSAAHVEGTSMHPTLNADYSFTGARDVVLLDRLSVRFSRLQRGDVVSLRSPEEPRKSMVKRLVAVEGDLVRHRDTQRLVQVPRGRCWVEGDNALHSRDSNEYGPVPMALVDGRVVSVLWPAGRLGAVANRPVAERVITPVLPPVASGSGGVLNNIDRHRREERQQQQQQHARPAASPPE